jgi:anthranilate phosphoribosyltransferase
LGFRRIDGSELKNGTNIDQAAVIFRNVLEGKGTEAQQMVVTANSALALQCYHKGKSLDECIDMARQSIERGKALAAFKKLMELQS